MAETKPNWERVGMTQEEYTRRFGTWDGLQRMADQKDIRIEMAYDLYRHQVRRNLTPREWQILRDGLDLMKMASANVDSQYYKEIEELQNKIKVL